MLYFISLVFLIFIDQFFKYYISHNFNLYQSVNLLGDLLYITYIKNAGAAFGILQNYRLLFIIITVLILFVVLFYFIICPKSEYLLRISLLFIFAGGLGNLIDRIRFGYVIDFIDIKIWPIFNFADSFVVVGSILLFYYVLFKHRG